VATIGLWSLKAYHGGLSDHTYRGGEVGHAFNVAIGTRTRLPTSCTPATAPAGAGGGRLYALGGTDDGETVLDVERRPLPGGTANSIAELTSGDFRDSCVQRRSR